MSSFSRKAISGTAAIITAATTAFMMAGAADAATTTRPAPEPPAIQGFQDNSEIFWNGIAGAPGIAASTIWPGMPTIGIRTSGPAVVAAQAVLRNRCGRNFLTIDGIFGSDTRSNVMAFQRSNRLPVDGIVGPMTWNTMTICSVRPNRLYPAPPPGPDTWISLMPTIGIRTSGPAVVTAQAILVSRCGFGDAGGRIDGIFGPITEAAIKGLQSRNGLMQTGVIDQPTWKAIASC